jgi:hypothetical protein
MIEGKLNIYKQEVEQVGPFMHLGVLSLRIIVWMRISGARSEKLMELFVFCSCILFGEIEMSREGLNSES